MMTKLKKIVYYKFELKDEIKNKLNFYKRAKEKIRNQKNKDQIEKYNICKLELNDEIKNK
jgi:hypothetical protein